MAFLYEYGLFLAKAVTLVGALLIVLGALVNAAQRQKLSKGHLDIYSLSEQFQHTKEYMRSALFDKKQLKKIAQEEKKAAKQGKTDETAKKRLFVLDFKGSMDAHEVEGLREEVTAILSVAEAGDEVLVRLESGGGVVHGYGLAASQLQRIRQKDIALTVSVDKVAASGGYLMACVANTIIAAPFAYIGSIGVLAQLPNFHKLLKKNDIEFEQHTAGAYKRTLTMFGHNTDEGREKFREELEEIHRLFKHYVQENRPSLDIEQVATGEYWAASRAQALGLVDALLTSDDYLMQRVLSHDIFKVAYSTRKSVAEKLGVAASTAFNRSLTFLTSEQRFWSR